MSGPELRLRDAARAVVVDPVAEVRWWSAEELAGSSELHAPRRLPGLVADLRANGPPPEPIDAGV